MITTRTREEPQIKFGMVKKGWRVVILVFIPPSPVKKTMLRPCRFDMSDLDNKSNFENAKHHIHCKLLQVAIQFLQSCYLQ